MDFLALATDFDGTLASDSRVSQNTVAALKKWADSGRKLILVTGRQLEELLQVFPGADQFDWVVAENGAVVYSPRTRESRLLADAVPPEFPAALRARGVPNVAAGRAIVATWRPSECTVLETLRDLGLDRQIIFNKNAVMVLPTGINKASGLRAVLDAMQISRHNVIGVGDAENDLPMLSQCEFGAAVDNALDTVKRKADLVLQADHGGGVEELIEAVLQGNLESRLASQPKRGLLLGTLKNDSMQRILLPSLGHSVLVAGQSGSGKSTVIAGLLERIAAGGYQFCIIDPEGDYENFEPGINLGNAHCVPQADEVGSLLERMYNCVVNLLGVSVDARPQFVSELLRNVDGVRARKGRPHWFVFDEAHHLFPSDVPEQNLLVPRPPKTSLLVTVHPDHLRKEALASIDFVIAVGKEAQASIDAFCRALSIEGPKLEPVSLEHGEVLLWQRSTGGTPLIVVAEPGTTEHKRHVRKYADGDLGPRSFVFRGPEGRLNLVAQNLNTFIRMAQGIDNETWCYHVRSGDISNWLESTVKNEPLAARVRELEGEASPASDAKERIVEAIRSEYTLPE